MYINTRRKLSARERFFPLVPEPDRGSKHRFRLGYEHPVLPVSIKIRDQLPKKDPCHRCPVHPLSTHPARAARVEREVITPQSSGTPIQSTPDQFDQLTAVHQTGKKHPVREGTVDIIR